MGNWIIGKSKKLLHTFIWDVIETEKTSPAGKTGNFVSLQSKDWVKAVIYNRDNGMFVLCHEFRQGVNKKVYEFPSGTVEDGERAEDACVREVEEETGYKVDNIKLMVASNPNPAFMTNTMSVFYVEVSGKPTGQNLDQFEDLTIVEVANPEEYLDGGLIDQLAWLEYCKLYK